MKVAVVLAKLLVLIHLLANEKIVSLLPLAFLCQAFLFVERIDSDFCLLFDQLHDLEHLLEFDNFDIIVLLIFDLSNSLLDCCFICNDHIIFLRQRVGCEA